MTKKISLVLLIGILLVASFMRLYMISQYMTFLGDEGRDDIVAKGILDGHLTLLGPRASAGDFFTGPIYYYMMAPFLWLFHLDPVGPAVMVALFGIATVFLIYYVGRQWFDEKTGLFAAALYAVSPLVIIYSHSSWNPNTVPFFSLLTLWLLYKAVTTTRSWRYFLAIGFLLGICIQLHYISLVLAATVAVSLVLMYWYLDRKLKIVSLLKNYLQIFIGFLVGFSPFLAFELRHNFMNLHAIAAFVTKDTTQNYANYHAFYQPIADVFFRLFGRLVFAFPMAVDYHKYPLINLQVTGLLIVVCAFASIFFLLKLKNKFVVILLMTWLVLGVLLFGFYKKSIYDYYFVFMFPLPFFFIGNMLGKLVDLHQKKIHYGVLVSIVLFLSILGYNLARNPFLSAPNDQKNQAKHIAEFIVSKTQNQPFNFALLSSGNSDHAYRYFMEVMGHAPVTIETPANDPERKSVTNQLLVACENENCKPQGNPLWEIAGFGDAKVVGSWNFSIVKVYKLVHTQQK